jgi:hypothetical protein
MQVSTFCFSQRPCLMIYITLTKSQGIFVFVFWSQTPETVFGPWVASIKLLIFATGICTCSADAQFINSGFCSFHVFWSLIFLLLAEC